MPRRSFSGTLAASVFSCAVLLAVWQAAAAAAGSPLVLPSPLDTCRALAVFVRERSFWLHVGSTAIRSVCAFVFAVCAGFIVGLLSALHPRIHTFMQFPLALIRCTPVVSFILAALFWFGSSAVPVFAAFIMCVPVMTDAVYKGACSSDVRLLEMARVYGLSPARIVRHIRVPSALPYVFAGMLSCFGLSWKVCAAGEVLTLPKWGTGTLLQGAKVHLNTDQVFAVTLVIAAASFTAERLLWGVFSLWRARRGS